MTNKEAGKKPASPHTSSTPLLLSPCQIIKRFDRGSF